MFRGECSIIFGTPEMLVECELELADDKYPIKMCGLIVDEVHCVHDWADFRPKYRSLSELKCMMSSQPWGLFTATCDAEMKKSVLKALSICTDKLELVSSLPDR